MADWLVQIQDIGLLQQCVLRWLLCSHLACAPLGSWTLTTTSTSWHIRPTYLPEFSERGQLFANWRNVLPRPRGHLLFGSPFPHKQFDSQGMEDRNTRNWLWSIYAGSRVEWRRNGAVIKCRPCDRLGNMPFSVQFASRPPHIGTTCRLRPEAKAWQHVAGWC